MAVRRVRRVVRKIDPWTVLKVSLVFFTVAVLAGVLGLVISWSLLENAGVPDSFTELVAKIGGPEITIEGGRYFRVVVFLGIVSVIMLTGLATLGAVLYNLIADVVGGIEIVVLEETVQMAQVRPNGPVRPATHTPPPSTRAAQPGQRPPPAEQRRLGELPTEETTSVTQAEQAGAKR